MSAMSSQITGVSIVYSTVCSGADQRKHQCSGDRWIPLTKGQWRVKCSNLMTSSWLSIESARFDNLNTVNPVCSVATVCHRVRCVYCGHLSYSRGGMSLSNWYKIILMGDLAYVRDVCMHEDMYMRNLAPETGISGRDKLLHPTVFCPHRGKKIAHKMINIVHV